MRFIKLLTLIIGVMGFLLQNTAFAKEEVSAPIPSLEEENLLFQEIPSVYSASKYEQKVTKAPASISIVTADEIKKWGYRTFGDILSSLKGFYNTNDRNYGFAGARGFGLPADFNSRLLLLIDGHRFNDNIYDSWDTSEGFPVDVDMIERVEVVRGPSSSLYGTSAFFGVINVITKRGRDQEGANIKASYGTNNTYKTSLSYGNRFNNGLEAFVTGTFYDSQGYNRRYYKEFDTPATNNGVSVHNDGEQARKLMTTLSFQDFTLQGLYVRRNKDVPTASFSTVFNSPAENTVDESTFLELKYNHTFTNQLNISSRISYNNYRNTGDFPLNNPGNPSDIIINKDLVRGQWLYSELEATKVLWNDHRLTAGGVYQNNFDQFLTNYDVATHIDSNENTYQWALFIQDEYSITSTLTLNAGVRVDYFSTFGTTANPRFALIYNPWEKTTVKLLYGTAFRAPNQYELNYNDGGISIIPSVNLKPEKLQTEELILEHYFNEHLRGEFNLFHTDITDIISLITSTFGLLQNQNGSEVESKGVEVQLEDNWANGFQARISYSWQDTENTATHERLPNSPEHMVKLNLIAPLWRDKLFLGFETQYMSSRITPPKEVNGNVNGKVGDHVISNITLLTQNWIKGLELSGGVYNLFDEQYFDPGSGQHRQNGIEQNGLTFRIKASVDF
ncbi:MAG: TonB-dependent receptor [Methylobacter sp.]|nr:TonB-dependent receptor [Methylobacter sp.]